MHNLDQGSWGISNGNILSYVNGEINVSESALHVILLWQGSNTRSVCNLRFLSGNHLHVYTSYEEEQGHSFVYHTCTR